MSFEYENEMEDFDAEIKDVDSCNDEEDVEYIDMFALATTNSEEGEYQSKVEKDRKTFESKKVAAKEVVEKFLAPYMSQKAYEEHRKDLKRKAALKKKVDFIMAQMPAKLGFSKSEEILLETAIKDYTAPKPTGHYFDVTNFDLDAYDCNWLCRELGLAPGDATIMVAEPGGGKTHLASHIALCVVSGQLVLGKFEIQQTGKVVHLNWDSSEKTTELGYKRLLNGMEIKIAPDAIYMDKPLWKMNQENAYENLTKVCKGNSLCIIDSLRECYDGDENLSDASKVISLANRVSEKTGCVIMFLAHTGKGGVSNKGIDALRGTSASAGAAGEMWTLEKANEEGALILKIVKTRMGQFKTYNYRYENTGEYMKNTNRTRGVKIVLESEGSNAKKSIRVRIIDALKNGRLCGTDLDDRVGGNASDRAKEKNQLIEDGIIARDMEGKKAWYSLKDG